MATEILNKKLLFPFLQGGGEMGELTRNYNWAGTSLGSPEGWPQSLRTTLGIMLHSKFPMSLFWSNDHIFFYNDAYRQVLVNDDKHPFALGKPGAVALPETWPALRLIIDNLQTGEEATWSEDQPVQVYCNGRMEDAYRTFSYSPVIGEKEQVEGILVMCSDTTEKVQTINRLQSTDQLLQNIVREAPLGIIVLTGAEMKVNIVNEAYAQLIGRTYAELVDKPLFSVIPEAESDFRPILDKVRLTDEPLNLYDYPYSVYAKGQEKQGFLNLVYQPYKEKDGSITGVVVLCHDVTDAVARRKKMKESEQQFLTLVMQAPVAIAVFRGDDFVADIVNDAYLPLVGKSREEFVGKPLFETLPGTKAILEPIAKEVVQTGKSFPATEFEIILDRNGKNETCYFNSVWEPLYENDGSRNGFIVVAHEVTEQVLARKKIEESEALLQGRIKERTAFLEQQKLFISSIVDASLNGIYSMQAVRNEKGAITDFRYLFANNIIAQLLGFSAEEMVGKSMLELIPENKTNNFFELFCRVLEERAPIRDETHFITGKLNNWFDYAIVPIDTEAVVVTVQDITDKKMAALEIEQQRNLLNNIMKHSPSGISVSEMVRNEKGEIISVRTILANASYEKYTGISLEDLLTKKLPENEQQLFDSPVFQQALHTLQTGEVFITQYYFEPTGRWLELSVAKMDDDHLINVFTDITAVKETQLQLERHVENLKRSNQNLEEFAHAASHDLKEPIRKIRTFADRLRQQLSTRTNEQEAGMFERMERATQRMQLLVDDLLEYSHVSHHPREKEEVNLNEKLKKVLEDLELDIEQKKAIVTVHQLPVIKGYKRQLQQLFQNLVSNALKYSRPGTVPLITITSKIVKGRNSNGVPSEVEDDVNYHLIEVSDNGIGFDQSNAERIFEMFQRLHGKTEYLGTGIGLSIARKVVENHSGKIVACGEPAKGATFKIYLPVL